MRCLVMGMSTVATHQPRCGQGPLKIVIHLVESERRHLVSLDCYGMRNVSPIAIAVEVAKWGEPSHIHVLVREQESVPSGENSGLHSNLVFAVHPVRGLGRQQREA